MPVLRSSTEGAGVGQPWLAQDLTWLLGSLCQLHRIPFDPALIAQNYPPPHSEVTFTEAASALGFKVGHCDATGRKPYELTFPLVALLRDAHPGADKPPTETAAAETQAATPAARPVLVVKADAGRVLYFRAQSTTGETVPTAEFAQRFEPVVLLVAHEAQAKAPDDDLWARDTQKFGFRWFIPELLKHKTIWRDVMLASFVLQLVGLTTPLFTQVIIDKVENDEIIPTVLPVPNTNIQDYYKLIVRRFSNPKIGDTERRLAFDGSNRQPKFIVPVIADNLAAGRTVSGLALESALWCRYCAGTTDSGKVIEPNDPIWPRLNQLAMDAKSDPVKWLGMEDIYGDTGKSEIFRLAFSGWLNRLWADGVENTLKAYVAGEA